MQLTLVRHVMNAEIIRNIQYISCKPVLPLLSYATCVRFTPTLGYNALLAAH